jgi:hypothetical protein
MCELLVFAEQGGVWEGAVRGAIIGGIAGGLVGVAVVLVKALTKKKPEGPGQDDEAGRGPRP